MQVTCQRRSPRSLSVIRRAERMGSMEDDLMRAGLIEKQVGWSGREVSVALFPRRITGIGAPSSRAAPRV